MHGFVDGLIAAWMVERLQGCMVAWMDGCMDGWWPDSHFDASLSRWMATWMNYCMNWWMGSCVVRTRNGWLHAFGHIGIHG